MNAFYEKVFAILGSSTLCSATAAFAVWGAIITLMSVI